MASILSKLADNISPRIPQAKDLLQWVQKELYPWMKYVFTCINNNADYISKWLPGTKRYHGVVNPTSISVSTFLSGSDQYIEVGAAGAFDVYYKGELFTISNSFALKLTENVENFIYLRGVVAADGTVSLEPVASTTAWDFFEHIPLYLAYWQGSTVMVWNEKHGYKRDLVWHKWAHDVIHARWLSGYALSNLTNTTFSFSTGSMCDEDILDSNVGPFTSCMMMYRNPSQSYMVLVPGRTIPCMLSGSTLPMYDNGGTLVQVTNTYHVNTWFYSSTVETNSIIAVVGQNEYANLADAQAELEPQIAGLTVKEFAKLYVVTWVRNGANYSVADTSDRRAVL